MTIVSKYDLDLVFCSLSFTDEFFEVRLSMSQIDAPFFDDFRKFYFSKTHEHTSFLSDRLLTISGFNIKTI